MQQSEKWALVTGASAGIGKEMCQILAQRKWNLILVARREGLLETLKSDLESKFKIKAIIQRADLCKDDDVQKIISLFGQYNIRFLANNAGVLSRGNFHEKDFIDSERPMALNMMALAKLSYGAIHHFKSQSEECYLLNVGSLNSYISTGGQAIYCGTKAFVKSFTLALSYELKNTQIKVSCLCPGGTESEIMEAAGALVTPKAQKLMMDASRVARLGINGVFSGKVIVIPGGLNKLSVLFSRWMPEKWMTFIASKTLDSAVRLKN